MEELRGVYKKTESSTRSHFHLARNQVEHDCYGSFGRLLDEEEVEIFVLNTQNRGTHDKTNVAWKSVGSAGLAREAPLTAKCCSSPST